MNELDPYYFYFELPIYSPVKIDDENDSNFWNLLVFNKTIDAYHPGLKENTTFTVSPCKRSNTTNYYANGGMDYCILTCVRTQIQYYFFMHYNKEAGIFQKIGQFPSIADFHISHIKKYDKVLSKEKLKEFTRAIGLAANGVGIGSFVYLRRIFEDLIEESHIKATINDDNWNEELYGKQRMAERIELLKSYLPSFLVENKNLYSILSVWIHSLKEDECLAYFETVRVGIELILDERVDEYNKIKKIEDAKQRLSSLTSKIQQK